MRTSTLLLCAFIIWQAPYAPGEPYVYIESHVNQDVCEYHLRLIAELLHLRFRLHCLPAGVNPNQR